MDSNGGGHQATANNHGIELMRVKIVASMFAEMNAIPELLDEAAGESSCSDFRVPRVIAGGNAEACRPRVISIGPYHHGEPQLQMLQEHKWRYLRGMLLRTQIQLKDLINVVAPKLKMIQQCYSESTNNFSGSYLVKMMVLDGCFIIEFLRRIAGIVQSDNILLHNPFMYVSLARDLLRLENQVPYFVLEDLCEIKNVTAEMTSLTDLVLIFFDNIVKGHGSSLKGHGKLRGVHLLDLLHRSLMTGLHWSLITGLQPDNGPGRKSSSYRLIRSASKLNQAGIAFALQEKACTFLEIKFKSGILYIPKLRIDDTLQCILHNMVAFERSSVSGYKHFTAYAVFMGSLIDTADDALLLCDHEVVSSDGLSKEGVASFFRDVCKDAPLDLSKGHLEQEIKEVNRYFKRRWIHIFFANLIYNLCHSTWTVIASVVMLTGTIQTVYTLLQYYHPR